MKLAFNIFSIFLCVFQVEQLTEEVRESQAREKNIQERVMQLEEEQEMQVKHAE